MKIKTLFTVALLILITSSIGYSLTNTDIARILSSDSGVPPGGYVNDTSSYTALGCKVHIAGGDIGTSATGSNFLIKCDKSDGSGYFMRVFNNNNSNYSHELFNIKRDGTTNIARLSLSGGSNHAVVTELGLTGSTAISVNGENGDVIWVLALDNSALTISAPTNIRAGQIITFNFTNSTGGSMGTVTWNSAYRLAGALTNPGNNNQRSITFYSDGLVMYELYRTAADVVYTTTTTTTTTTSTTTTT